MESRRLAVRGAVAGAAAFALLSVAFASGWLVPLDQVADNTFRKPFGHWSEPGGSYEYVVVGVAPDIPLPKGANGTGGTRDNATTETTTLQLGGTDGGAFGGTGSYVCQRADTLNRVEARTSYTAPRTTRCAGNFSLTMAPGGFWRHETSWGGYASYLGSEPAAVAVLCATALLLAALGRWRLLAIALTAGIVGGALVDPLKDYFRDHPAAYGDMPALYPSGHTIGGTLQFGLFIVLGALALQRAGLARPRLLRHAVVAWGVVSFAVGMDRVVTGVHILSDVLAGWAFGLAFVCAAYWLATWPQPQMHAEARPEATP